MLFHGKTGSAKIRTPDSFQQKARHDIEAHVESLSNPTPKQKTTFKNRIRNRGNSRTEYAASPLGRTVTTPGEYSASDDCSTIDSGRSGKSLSANSVQRLMSQQHAALSRIQSLNTDTSVNTSLFDANQLHSIYTNVTSPSSSLPITGNHEGISLHDALPHDFSEYYAPDLDVTRFSNGRPRYTKRDLKHWELNDTRSLLIFTEWEGKIPQVKSPIHGKSFRIQIIPNYFPDDQIALFLAKSDIYLEAKFDEEFRLHTARFVIQKARIRHMQVLVSSFGVPENYFNESHITGNIEYDCYFKFEWRNIIENFLLNLAIEYQCRYDYKLRIQKLMGIDNEKRIKVGLPVDHEGDIQMSYSKPSGSLYKKTLIRQGFEINDEMKAEIWKDVQNKVYMSLDDPTVVSN